MIILQPEHSTFYSFILYPVLCLNVNIKYLLRVHLRITQWNRHKRHGIIPAFILPLTAESAAIAVSCFSWCLTQSDCVGQTNTYKDISF